MDVDSPASSRGFPCLCFGAESGGEGVTASGTSGTGVVDPTSFTIGVRVSLLIVAALAAGCASGGPRPGVGDISFRLAWEGEADLDLYVLSPLGERIDFAHREASSGGRLDIDCNVTRPELVPGSEGEGDLVPVKLRCPRPMENVFWPGRSAPPGAYGVQVVLADGEGALDADRYRLELRCRRYVARRWEGSVRALGAAPLRLEVTCPDRE